MTDDDIFSEAINEFEKAQGSFESTKQQKEELSEEVLKAMISDNDSNPFEKFSENMRGIFIKKLNNYMLTAPPREFMTLFNKYAEYILPKKTRIENDGSGSVKKIAVTITKQTDYEQDILDDILGKDTE